MILFVGNREKGYFIEDVVKEFDYVDSSSHITSQVNAILEKPCSYMIFDVEQYIDSATDIADNVSRIRNANGAKVIAFAPGYLASSDIVVQMMNHGVTYFIFATKLSDQKDQLQKCLNGYYDANGLEEIKHVVLEKQDEELKKNYNCKFIGVAGACSRMGTTTQCIQLVKYLLLKGYKACYIQMNSSKYTEYLSEWYEVDKNADMGCVSYQYVDHYYQIEKLPEILKRGYDYFVYDFGVYTDRNFNKTSFLEKDIHIFVVGSTPAEMESTYDLLRNNYYNDVSYIFNFTPEGDKKELLELMEEKAENTYFAPFAPDPYVLSDATIYENLIPVEQKGISEKERKHFWKRWDRKNDVQSATV